MPVNSEKRRGFYGWLADFTENHSSWLIFGVIVITALLVIPLFLMQPTESASDNPTGSDVVKWYQEIGDTFPSEVYTMPFIVEADNGDMLTRDNLYELYKNEQALRDGSLSPFLYERYNETAGVALKGVYSLADSVNIVLMYASHGAVSLANATDTQVKQAVQYVLESPLTSGMEIELSVLASYEEGPGGTKLWKSPALLFVVESDREKVQQAYPASIGQEYSELLALEHFGRFVGSFEVKVDKNTP